MLAQQQQSKTAPPGKPLWRRAFDAVEKQVAPPIEGTVRTATFADATALAVKVQARLRRMAADRTARLWHLVNLPAASDVARLREQVALLDHEIRQLGHGVEDATHALTGNSRREARNGRAAQPRSTRAR